MNTLKTIFAAGAVAAALAGSAGAAWYVKFDGVDGEAKAAACAQAQSASREHMAGRPSEETATDDCATQTVEYGKDGKKEGNVETTWKVEEGEK